MESDNKGINSKIKHDLQLKIIHAIIEAMKDGMFNEDFDIYKSTSNVMALLNQHYKSGYDSGLIDGYKIGLDENYYSILKNKN